MDLIHALTKASARRCFPSASRAGGINLSAADCSARSASAPCGTRTSPHRPAWQQVVGAVVLDSVLASSQRPGDDAVALPDTGDIEADLKRVLRATTAEFSDPEFEAPIRALNVEIINDPELAAAYRERLERPMNEAKKERLRSAQRAGQIAADADLDLFLDVLYAPLTQRWLVRTGPLDNFADALVHTALRAFRPI